MTRKLLLALLLALAAPVLADPLAPPNGSAMSPGALRGDSALGITSGAGCVQRTGQNAYSVVDCGGGSGIPAGSNGQLQFNDDGSFGALTIGGDATLNTGSGALTVTKTNGVSFAASATTDATNASNIGSGTLNQARLPAMLGTSGVWSSRPSSPTTGQMYFATDIGSGIWITWNGAKWKPFGGVAVLVFDGAAHQGAGAASETNYATVTIPAGLVSATGGIRFIVHGIWSGTNGNKSIIIRHNATSGATTSGTLLVNGTFGSNTALSAIVAKMVLNSGAVNVQTTVPVNINGLGNNVSATVGELAGSIDMANASYLNFNMQGNASDTVGFKGISVEWIEF